MDLRLVGTYSGHLEGSRESLSPHILKELPRRIANELDTGTPLAIIPPDRMPLPDWLCIAQLESRKPVHTNDPDYNSRLFACSFIDDTSQSIDEMINAMLSSIDWNVVAEDYSIMDF